MDNSLQEIQKLYIIGLGNPGIRYAKTRHNAGFWVLDALCRKNDIGYKKPLCSKFEIAKLSAERETKFQSTWLIKPMTFMNNSGDILPDLMKERDKPHCIIITDNLDLPPGQIRMKTRIGSGGGHNGLRSIRQHGFSHVWVLYIGIGRPTPDTTIVEHVLGIPDSQESVLFDKSVQRAVSGLETCMYQGLQDGLNEINAGRTTSLH